MEDGAPIGATATAEAGGVGPPGPAMGAASPPLAVSGLVVAKAALLRVLRWHVPQAADIEPLDGDRFLLVLAGVGQGQQVGTE